MLPLRDDTGDTDVVGEFVRACRENGLAAGIYYCAWDNHHPFFSLMPDKSENYGGALITPKEKDLGIKPPPYTTHLYQNFMIAQIDEIMGLLTESLRAFAPEARAAIASN